ncbi:MAG: hypothetical protein A2534_04665 [Candidatus Magasanikbacteria bacterium RIFOXYD2_FULL_39_9]|uniref:HD/PDEase domain-containing protein n=1 Tax=Candidatus Magasanikbacteria bacterium RIFOXYD1_FULL_40_23 TaxID=1798705 RepID=A0A1F6PAY6_9BACT|nr:MAG: hypothetical protein A2534_04665 [Candidatus Magasanikbacteria bacterium RIFOXYD2_FULL_39_9]OGH93309.1 MAG: hypothetical protein A2563_01740 [Candidatus Magasanikbacteria bacterium RIFOXYD1_FULL_40_23]
MLKLVDLNIENIKSGKLINELPEFYALKDVIENNAGHINDPVFDHCVRAGAAVLKLCAGAPQKIKEILQQQIGAEKREELLFIIALFHDVGKIKVSMDAQGGFIGHEQAGAELMQSIILKRTDISSLAQAHVVSVIENHGLLHVLSNDQDHLEDRVLEAAKKQPAIFPELILLVLADLIASDLIKLNPTVYNFKISFFERMLVSWSK